MDWTYDYFAHTDHLPKIRTCAVEWQVQQTKKIIMFNCCTVYIVLRYQNVKDGVDWFNKQCPCLASRDHPSFRIQRESIIMLYYKVARPGCKFVVI